MQLVVPRPARTRCGSLRGLFITVDNTDTSSEHLTQNPSAERKQQTWTARSLVCWVHTFQQFQISKPTELDPRMIPAGVYVEEGPERDALTAALGQEGYIPVYLDEKLVRDCAAATGGTCKRVKLIISTRHRLPQWEAGA